MSGQIGFQQLRKHCPTGSVVYHTPRRLSIPQVGTRDLAAELDGIAGIPRRLFAARSLLRAERGRAVTQAEIGRAVGVTEGQIGHWEKGRQTPDLPMIEKLAAALDVAAPWLAYGVGPKERPAEIALPVTPDPALDRKLTKKDRRASKKVVDAATPRRRRGNE